MIVVTDRVPFKDENVLVGKQVAAITFACPSNPWLAAVNSFGFGGANCHVLLEWNAKAKIRDGQPDDNIPRLICASGRVEESVTSILDDVKSRPLDAEFVNLFHRLFRYNTATHKCRGYAILARSGEIGRSVQGQVKETPKLTFLFSGFSSFPAISSEWFALPVVRTTLKK